MGAKDTKRWKALSDLAKATVETAQPRPSAQIESLEKLAIRCKVTIDGLESHIFQEMESFCKNIQNNSDFNNKNLCKKLHVLFSHAQQPNRPEWLSHASSYDSFMKHFCPQADSYVKSRLGFLIKDFMKEHTSRMLMTSQELQSSRYKPSHSEPGSWVKLPQAWVDVRVIDEAKQLAKTGFPRDAALFTHGTGSAAMEGISHNASLLSARLALSKGGEVRTGEYVSCINSATLKRATGHSGGLASVYASKEGLASDDYTMQRWFNEFPITFGISEDKQRKHAAAQGETVTDQALAGIGIGSSVPLENVVAISAPKANEDQVRAWIEANCPHAQFMSYEAAALLKSPNMFGALSK